MMTGGGMMLAFGLLTMLIVLGLPALLIVAFVAGLRALLGRHAEPGAPPAPPSAGERAPAGRGCAHCGFGLQSAWTHCPNCGAPITANQ